MTLNDKGSSILGTHVKNISKHKFLTCVAYVDVYNSPIMHTGEEHKAHAVQDNNKNDNYK